MAKESEECHWNHVQMVITTQVGNLLLEFLFKMIMWKLSQHIQTPFLPSFETHQIVAVHAPVSSYSFVSGYCQSKTEQWCRIWHPGAQREAAYCKWSCAVDCWPAATTIRAEEDRYEEPTPPGPSRRWRREYHTLLVSCKGNYCWLKLLNICLLAPQSTL